MRSMRALMAVCGIAGTLATTAAMGQAYSPSPSMLRYPIPQTPTTAAPVSAASMQPPMSPYYAANPAPGPASYAAAYSPPGYAQGAWTNPPVAPAGTQRYWYVPQVASPAQPVAYPGYYQPVAPPRAMDVALAQSVLAQPGTAPAEVVAPPVQTQPSPSDAPYQAPPSGGYYYPETAPYPATNAVAPNGCPSGAAGDPNCGGYGGWSPYSPYGSGYAGCAGPPVAGAPYGYGYGYGDGCGAPCGPPPACGPVVCAPRLWFAGVYGLYMSRDNENHYMFSYDDAWESDQRTDSRDANSDYGGVEVRFGRYFNCCLNAIEAVYWGLYPDDGNSPFPDDGYTQTTSADVTGNLDGILNWDDLNYNGSTAEWWVNDAVVHAVFRENEFHNVEINLLQFNSPGCAGGCGPSPCGPCDPCGPCAAPCGSRFQYAWLAGVRWFHFRDALVFGADTVNAAFTYAPEEIFYRVQTVNNLVGFQLGGRGEYNLTPRLAIDFGHKVGLYGNHSEHEAWIGGAAGTAVINNGPNDGRAFDISAAKDSFSLLGEVRVGLSYRVTPRWLAAAGYRMVGATGVALPTNQIYPDLRGINDLQNVDSNGSVILHGVYIGAEYRF